MLWTAARSVKAQNKDVVARLANAAAEARAVHEWLWPCGTAFQAVDTGKMPVPRMHEDTPNRELFYCWKNNSSRSGAVPKLVSASE